MIRLCICNDSRNGGGKAAMQVKEGDFQGWEFFQKVIFARISSLTLY